jgi:hypothetical protein
MIQVLFFNFFFFFLPHTQHIRTPPRQTTSHSPNQLVYHSETLRHALFPTFLHHIRALLFLQPSGFKKESLAPPPRRHFFPFSRNDDWAMV